SHLGLVLAFVALGPQYTEPQDLWWIPMGPWMIVTYAILIGGGLFIGWELKLLGLELGYMAAFALFVALALIPVPDHCMIASWYATPMCGQQLWQILVTSPEVLIFAFFMVPDPRTVPDGQVGRFVFGVIVALLSVVLLGPTTLEFWTKTAILASLVFACAGRFALMRLVAPLEEAGGGLRVLRAVGWSSPPGPAASATQMAHAVVLNLMIESEARRAHDPKLAADGAVGDALTEFTDVIQADGSGKFVQKTYSFDRVELVLYLPKFSTQASRLVGV